MMRAYDRESFFILYFFSRLTCILLLLNCIKCAAEANSDDGRGLVRGRAVLIPTSLDSLLMTGLEAPESTEDCSGAATTSSSSSSFVPLESQSCWHSHAGMHKEVVHSITTASPFPKAPKAMIDILLIQAIPTMVYFDHYEFARNVNTLKNNVEFVNVHMTTSFVDSESIYETPVYGRCSALVEVFAIELLNVTSPLTLSTTFHTRYHQIVPSSSHGGSSVKFAIPDVVIMSRYRDIETSESGKNRRKKFYDILYDYSNYEYKRGEIKNTRTENNIMMDNYSTSPSSLPKLIFIQSVIGDYEDFCSGSQKNATLNHTLVAVCNSSSESAIATADASVPDESGLKLCASFHDVKSALSSSSSSSSLQIIQKDLFVISGFPVSTDVHASMVSTITFALITLSAVFTITSHLYC